MAKSPKIIQSVQRAIDIISCFHNTPVELGLNEISEALSLNKSTVHGIISTLCLNDYIVQSPSGKYKLGPVFTESFGDNLNAKKIILKERAQSAMHMLADKFFGSVALFLREGNDLVILNRITPTAANYVITVHDSIINPLHTSASGKLLLATFNEKELLAYIDRNPLVRATEHTLCSIDDLKKNLNQIRLQQFSTEDEELGLGIYAVSVPIYDDAHKLFATLSITGLSTIIKGNEDLIRNLKNVAATISRQVFC